MASNLTYIPFISQILFLIVFSVSCSNPLCDSDERSALLQFKQSFVIDSSASFDTLAYPKVASWKNDSNCCLWDGVECDEVSGHVVGLDLSSSCLFGPISSNSSLFQLVHLRRLNLADNNFNLSQIPPKLGNLSSLTYLNLSMSVFYGQVPLEIIGLCNLISLDLGGNSDDQGMPLLQFESSNLKRLVENAPVLEKLYLNYVNFSSTLSDVFANFSSLRFLNLMYCQFHGVLPSSLGELTKLRFLNLANNPFSGEIPSWLGNFTHLEFLDLSYINFTEGAFPWLGNQKKLSYLHLANVNLVGQIPPSLKNLTNLRSLHLSLNGLSGQIPYFISNLTQLTSLQIGDNLLHGPIPMSIFQLVNIEDLILQYNYLTDSVMFDMFTRLAHLKALGLSGNNLTLFTNLTVNATLLNFHYLGLGQCNLRGFPSFIRHQQWLSYLDISGNQIKGKIPKWIGKLGAETLEFLDLSQNLLNGFVQISVFSLFTRLFNLNLGYNKLEGKLPRPPLSIQYYVVSYNSITGEIPELFCNLSSLNVLDFSGNNLHGIIPQCLVNVGGSLLSINLAENSFNGRIPDICPNGSSLMMIDLSNNQLEGQLPRSMTKCTMLQSLQVNNNHIRDTFPLWLGNLPNLQVLILRENHFYGTIENRQTLYVFFMLRILDLSHNEFTGILPTELFRALVGMRSTLDIDQLYMQKQLSNFVEEDQVISGFAPQLILANKGLFLKYWRIPNLMAVIDISSNKFQGNIPKTIGTLKMLNVLNFSNNHLSGHIPSDIGNLTKLESLDLSCNNLSGMIPSRLAELTFLEYFNVSNNHLNGPIPQGKQLATFDNISYQGNSGLCGSPLTKSCEKSDGSPQPQSDPTEDGGSNLPINVHWKTVLIGYGSGFVVGVLLGLRFFTTHCVWLSNTFGINLTKSKRRGYIRRGGPGGIH